MNLLSALFSLAARFVLAVASLLLVLVLVAVGATVFIGVLLWSLLRGRKPTLHTAAFRRAGQAFGGGAGSPFGGQFGGQFGGRSAGPFGTAPGASGVRQPQGEVVDVEVREVTPAQPRLDLDR